MTKIPSQSISFTLLLSSCLFITLTNATIISGIQDLPQRLPHNMIPFKPPSQIFSGFAQSYVVNVEAQSSYRVLADIELLCALNLNESPFYSRLYIVSETEAYYYCPKLHVIYKLNPDANFIFSGLPIALTGIPIFNETRFVTPYGTANFLYILGLIDDVNLQDPEAHNFTASYFLTVNLTSHELNCSNITGAHHEPIVSIDVMSDGEVVATGEKLYTTHQKLNTYYLGNFGQLFFNQVIDFYIAPSFGFLPQIKIMMNNAYIFYTSQTSFFRYTKKSGIIQDQTGVTLISNVYTRGDGTQLEWNEVPMTASADGNSIYVYNQGAFTKFDVATMKQIASIPVPFNMSNETYCQFYFYQEGTTETAFVQLDDHSLSFALDSN